MTPTAPVVLFVFNRLETTAQVYDRIADARPQTLLVVADGPRDDHPLDAERCEAVRRLVSRPHWDCDVRMEFAPRNLGFKRRISSGLAWAFDQCEELIILEDDCLPDATFFPFCTELLERYRLDEQVKMISGCNFQFGRRRGAASYYASRGAGTWGWASWRRVFRQFDPDIRDWPRLRATDFLRRIWGVNEIADYWRDCFDDVMASRVDTWDYQWAFCMWKNDGLQVASNQNLIRYIGCLPDTTHTKDPGAPFCNIPTVPMPFPLRHLTQLEVVRTADLFEFYRVFFNLEDHDAERRSVEGATRDSLLQSDTLEQQDRET